MKIGKFAMETGRNSSFPATKAENQRVAVALFKWLSNDKYPSDAHRERRKENITIKSSGMLKLFLVGLFPLPFFIIGLLVLKNRRNH